jgi:hypothetical protein
MKKSFLEEIQTLKNQERGLREELVRLNKKLELSRSPSSVYNPTGQEHFSTAIQREEPDHFAKERTALADKLEKIELAMKELHKTHETAIRRLTDSTKMVEIKELKEALLKEVNASKTQEHALRGELVHLSSKLDTIESSRNIEVLDQQKSLADLLGGVESQVSKALSQIQERETQLEQETQRKLLELRERQEAELKLAQCREKDLQNELVRLRETIESARYPEKVPQKSEPANKEVSIISSTFKHIESLKHKMDSAQKDTVNEIKQAHELKLAETVRLMESNISSLRESHAREIAALKDLSEKETALALHKQGKLNSKVDELQQNLSEARLDKLEIASSHAQELAARKTAHEGALSLLRDQQKEELSKTKQYLDSQRDNHLKVLAEIERQHAKYANESSAKISLLKDQLSAIESAKSLAEEESSKLRLEIQETRRILSELSELKEAEMQQLVKQADDIGQEKVLSIMNYNKQLELKCSGLHEALNKGHVQSVEVRRKNDMLKVWVKQLKEKKTLADVKNQVLESKIRLSSLETTQLPPAPQHQDDLHGLRSSLQQVHAKIQSDRSRVETLTAILTGSHADSPFTMKLLGCLIAVYDISLASWAATQKLVGQDFSRFEHRELIQTRHSLEAIRNDSVDFDHLFNLLHQQSIRSQLELRRATEQATQESTKRLKRMIKSKQDAEVMKKTVSNTSSQTSWETSSVHIQAVPEPKIVQSVSTQVSMQLVKKKHSSSSQTPSYGHNLVEAQTEMGRVSSVSADCQTDGPIRDTQNGFAQTDSAAQSSRDSQTVMIRLVSQTSQTDFLNNPVRKSTKKSAISVISSQKEALVLELKQVQEESRLRLDDLEKTYQCVSTFCPQIIGNGAGQVNTPVDAQSALQKVVLAWQSKLAENLDLETTANSLAQSLKVSEDSLGSLSRLASSLSSGIGALNLSVISHAEKANTQSILAADTIRDLKDFSSRISSQTSVKDIERFFQKLGFLLNHIQETERQERVSLELKSQKNDSEIIVRRLLD